MKEHCTPCSAGITLVETTMSIKPRLGAKQAAQFTEAICTRICSSNAECECLDVTIQSDCTGNKETGEVGTHVKDLSSRLNYLPGGNNPVSGKIAMVCECVKTRAWAWLLISLPIIYRYTLNLPR
jgi:hypothetical protein